MDISLIGIGMGLILLASVFSKSKTEYEGERYNEQAVVCVYRDDELDLYASQESEEHPYEPEKDVDIIMTTLIESGEINIANGDKADGYAELKDRNQCPPKPGIRF